MSNLDEEISAQDQPLEFAVLALDMLTEQSLTESDGAEFESVSEDSGFVLKTAFGNDIILDISYNETEKTLTASASTPMAPRAVTKVMHALALNDMMPANRRFAINGPGQALLLRETWRVSDLVLAEFVLGLHALVQSLYILLNGPGALAGSTSGAQPTGLRG